MAHALSLLFEVLLLAIHKAGGIEFVILILHEVGLAAVVLYLILHSLELPLLVLHLGICRAILIQFVVVVGYDVNHAELEVLATEKQVLVLAMHVDETLAQLLEKG